MCIVCGMIFAQLTFQADVQVIGFELLVVVFTFIFDRIAHDAVDFLILVPFPTWLSW